MGTPEGRLSELVSPTSERLPAEKAPIRTSRGGRLRSPTLVGETGAMEGSREGAGMDAEGVRLQLLLAEWQWAAGLVQYHRDVELKALAGNGLVISAVAAAYAALEAGEGGDPATAEATVMAVASCVAAFIVLVAVTASMRAMRAASYVREWLHPLATEMSGDGRYLAWELVTDRLYQGLAGPFGRGLLLRTVASTTVVVLVALTSVLLGVAAWVVDDSAGARVIATFGAVCAVGLAFLGVWVAELWERADAAPARLRAELERRAKSSGRAAS
jgi:hypothetical protein